jgi:glutathione S-transferase
MFLAEKKVQLDTVEVNLLGREHLSEEYKTINPEGQYPILKFDDGSVLAESLAICEYLEESYPQPLLIGSTARERAETRMWCRRIDLRIMEPAIQAFKATAGYEFFKDRYFLLPNAAEELAGLSEHNKQWLDRQLGGHSFICGDRFSLADIQLWCFMDKQPGKGISDACDTLGAWFERVGARPSACASE